MRWRRCVIEGYLSGKTKLDTGLEHLDPESITSAMVSSQAKHRTELQVIGQVHIFLF